MWNPICLYNAWLLINLMPTDVVFSFVCDHCLQIWAVWPGLFGLQWWQQQCCMLNKLPFCVAIHISYCEASAAMLCSCFKPLLTYGLLTAGRGSSCIGCAAMQHRHCPCTICTRRFSKVLFASIPSIIFPSIILAGYVPKYSYGSLMADRAQHVQNFMRVVEKPCLCS